MQGFVSYLKKTLRSFVVRYAAVAAAADSPQPVLRACSAAVSKRCILYAPPSTPLIGIYVRGSEHI